MQGVNPEPEKPKLQPLNPYPKTVNPTNPTDPKGVCVGDMKPSFIPFIPYNTVPRR